MTRWADLTRDAQDAYILDCAIAEATPELTHDGWRNRIAWNVAEPEQASPRETGKPARYFQLWVWRDQGGVRAQITKRPA